jgi:endonuclease G, mitochondrial
MKSWQARVGLGIALVSLSAGCFRRTAPPPAPVSTPSVYGGDRSGDGGLIKNAPGRRTNGSFGQAASQTTETDNLVLGNPDGASKSETTPDHFLVARTQYALSYNDSLRYPNWVSWRLIASDIGDIPRGNFSPDPDLPFRAVTPGDYTGSGYDRGHNCPSKDRTASKDDNDTVFYMSNMTPQRHEMNAGPWERLETYSFVGIRASRDEPEAASRFPPGAGKLSSPFPMEINSTPAPA